MTPRALGFAVVGIALAPGCGITPEPTTAPERLAPPSVAEPARAAGPAVTTIAPTASAAEEPPPAPAPQPPNRISSAGVGPIAVDTPDDIESIRAGFPALTVSLEERQAEDHDVGEYTVSDGKRRVLVVIFDRFRGRGPFRVDVLGDPFRTEGGIGVGSTVEQARAAYPDLTCRFERYDPSLDIYRVGARFFCETSAIPNVQLDLDALAWRGREGLVGVASVARRAIVRVTWLAPR